MLNFEGLEEMFRKKVEQPCAECRYCDTYGTTEAYKFGGVSLAFGARIRGESMAETMSVFETHSLRLATPFMQADCKTAHQSKRLEIVHMIRK